MRYRAYGELRVLRWQRDIVRTASYEIHGQLRGPTASYKISSQDIECTASYEAHGLQRDIKPTTSYGTHRGLRRPTSPTAVRYHTH